MSRLLIILSTPLFILSGVTSCSTNAPESMTTLAYVANAGNNHVEILNLKTGETVNKLYTGNAPWRLVLSPDDKRLVVQHWYSETSAVVNLATNEIETVLPVRGPGLFDPAGERFLSTSWPSSMLESYDANSFARQKQYPSEDKAVFDMTFWGEEYLAKGQYDPVSKVNRVAYDSALISRSADLTAISGFRNTGTSPARLVVDPTGEFLITANLDSNDLSIINKLSDGRRIALDDGPRDVVFNSDGTRMVVITWKPGERESVIYTLKTDFDNRPWPAIEADKIQRLKGGLTDAQMGPDGQLYVLDRLGNMLRVFNSETLAEVKSFEVGDEPTSFVLRQVANDTLAGLSNKTTARVKLEAIIERVKLQSEPFTTVAFNENRTPAGESAEAGNAVTSKTMLKLPNTMRQELPNGGIRLAQGGHAFFISEDGRYRNTPRQDLLHVLYTMGSLETEDVIRELAGDVPGSPFLRNGIAIDLVVEIEENGHAYTGFGATEKGGLVSQLWFSNKSGLPVDLVEQFPVIRAKNPHQPSGGFQGLAETKLHYHEVNGRTLPIEMTRYVDGREVATVKLTDVVFDQDIASGEFDLAQLGGFLKTKSEALPLSGGADDKPGHAVKGQGNLHIDSPRVEHEAYNTNPPTSGPHTPYTAKWGVHEVPVAPELQVHNLEHGGVLLQYNCPESCPELTTHLAAVAENYSRVLVAPYPLMESKIALTAWERIDTLDTFDEKRITDFVEAYHGKDHHVH